MANVSQSAGSRPTSRPAAFVQTPQRGVLFGQLLRAGPARSGPIFDRLDAAGVAHIVTVLSAEELGLLARLVLAPERVARAVTFDTPTLVRLAGAATRFDHDRLFASLPMERATEVRRALELTAQDVEPVAAEPAARRGVVVRLKKLFRL